MKTQERLDSIDNFLGYLGLFFTTTCYSGMFLWIFGKKGKGGGTITSIFVTIVLLLLYSFKVNTSLSLFFLVCINGLIFLLGLAITQPVEEFMLQKWGARQRHTGDVVRGDFNETTIDEAHGMLIAVLPIYLFQFSFVSFLIAQIVALAAFRFFDVKKPWPIKAIEKLTKDPTATTIMLDDSLAGIYAMVITFLVCLIIKNWNLITIAF